MGHAIFTFLLSIKGWRTYVSIVVFIFAATWLVGFLIERWKARNGQIKLAFVHKTTDIVNDVHFLDTEDLIVTFRQQVIRGLCYSRVHLTNEHDRAHSLGDLPCPGSLRIDMKGGTQIYTVRDEMPSHGASGLKTTVLDQQDAAEIAFDTLGPKYLVEIGIFHSRRSSIYLTGNISGKSVKIANLGDPSMIQETKDIIICGVIIFVFTNFDGFIQKMVGHNTDLLIKNSLQIILVLVSCAFFCRMMWLLLQTGRKRRLLRRLKLPYDAQFAPVRAKWWPDPR